MSFPRLLLTGLFVAGLGSLPAQQPRVATVDASELFTRYHRTETEKAKLAEKQRKLAQDPRTAVIAQTINELRELEAQVRNTDHSEDSREEFFRRYQMKAHELRSLQRDTTQYREEQQKKINEQLVKISKILLTEVHSTIRHVAAAEGYDMVLEVGGDTSSQVPTLLYIRHATDITAQVLKELNQSKPAELPPGVTPAPAGPTPPAPIPDPLPIPDPVPIPPAPTPPPLAPAPAPPATPVLPTPVPPASTPIPRAVPAEEDE